MSCYIIAEIGVNHNGDVGLAKKLIIASKDAGADAVKFQTFKSELLVTESAKKADYQLNTTSSKESQLTMLKRLELSEEQHFELYDFCQKQGIEFLSTPFDFESLKFLTQQLKLKTLKLSSGDLTNLPMLFACAKSGRKLIISTGMATIDEIEIGLAVLSLGYILPELLLNNFDVIAKAKEVFKSSEGQEVLRSNVTLLHCTTSYPTRFSDINLNVLDTYIKMFKLDVGYSDHSLGTLVSIAAVAKGAKIIEKHITLDKSLPGPDHLASIEPKEFKELVEGIREVELILGQSIKVPLNVEKKNMSVARKSLVAGQNIRKGDVFSEENIAIKRPGNGMSPYHYWSILGEKSEHDFSAGELIRE